MPRHLLLLAAVLLVPSAQAETAPLTTAPFQTAPTQATPTSLRSPQARMVDGYLAYGQFKMGRYAQAFEIWQRLAAEGDADAAFQLGVMLEDGRGQPADLVQALGYYHQASNAGSSRAAHRLAALYATGAPGLPADPTLSRHYRALAEAGD